MAVRETAICLRTTDYSETSQVVHFLTRGSGVVRLIAKGSKRPKSASGGPIDLLSEGDLVFSPQRSEGLGILMEFSQTQAHPGLRRRAERLHAALYMIELVGEMLAEGDPHPAVFDLLHYGLLRLSDSDSPVPAVVAYLQWRRLKHAGLLGDLTACVVCGGPVRSGQRREAHFSSSLGGLLCGECQATAPDKFRLNGPALAGLAALPAAQAAKRSGGKVQLPDAQADAVNRMLAYHVTQLLGKPLKLARHVITSPDRRG